MVSKIDQIREALARGDSTRTIATNLKVSLRDIAKVRKDLGIDFGALERQKTSLNEEIERLNEEIRQKQSYNNTLAHSIEVAKNQLAQGLDREFSAKKNELAMLDAEVESRRRLIQVVPRFVIQDVRAPSNSGDVEAWLNRLDPDQLGWLGDKAYEVCIRKRTQRLQRQMEGSIERYPGARKT